jgi:hypothetical protein|tara:strand:+ start:1271 stop:2044 length:774 start_codon:yes stop_codon:yes gene_type:complete
MNLLLIVNPANLDVMSKVALAMAEKQTELVNGGLCIVHDQAISNSTIAEKFHFLGSKFKASRTVSSHLNSSLTDDAQLALLFGVFIMRVYSTFPGSWTIVDSESYPLVENFMQAAERQHGAYGGRMTGRGIKTEGAIVPVGPVTIDLSHREVKFLRYPVGESWRERGKYQFARSKFSQVNTDEYLWSLDPSFQVEKEEPESDPPVEEEKNEDPPDDTDFSSWEKHQLMDYIEKQTGVRPHHAKGFNNLVTIAESNTK